MCGICGIVNFKGEPVKAEVLKKMNSLLTHRGPDDDGYFFSRDAKNQSSSLSVGMGMRRLSIIDLETGNQPIFNE
jgi:asparagine synthase (glutamine-hydrolysing)